MTCRLVLAALVVITSQTAVPSYASAACCDAKLRASGARQKAVLRCHARAAAHGVVVEPTCIIAARSALVRTFTRIEEGDDCAVGDAPLVAADIERVGGELADVLRPVPTASACAARKLKAAGRLATLVARAMSQYAPRPSDHLGDLDPILTALLQRFATTFAKLESRPGCLTTGDAAYVGVAIASGVHAPVSPDGALLASLRVCPACGDGVQGGGEQCDAPDSASCDGPCSAACTCPSCGDGVKNHPSEACDGADAAACPGLCRSDCTCPAPVCGNGIKEAGEACDGTSPGSCAGCQADCTCPPAVCGNGIVEAGEACDGATCLYQGEPLLDCNPHCQCCSYADCYDFGCCLAGEQCFPAPSTGYCFKVGCATDDLCGFGYTCQSTSSLPSFPPSPSAGYPKACFGLPGSYCVFPDFRGVIYIPCAAPATCSGATCCLPAGQACTSNAQCCSGTTCTGGVCG